MRYILAVYKRNLGYRMYDYRIRVVLVANKGSLKCDFIDSA